MMLTSNALFAVMSAALRALDQPTGRSGTTTARPLAGMPMDAYRVGDNFVAHFDLPGVDPGSIDLQVEGTTLTISAKHSVPQIEGAQWQVAEQPNDSNTHQQHHDHNQNTNHHETSNHDGVL